MSDTTREEYRRLCRAQRAAYDAWQSAPAGPGWGAALENYLRASAALEKAQQPELLRTLTA